MARKEINIGLAPMDGTGTPLRVGGIKINDNFEEVYQGIVEVNDSPTSPDEGHILIYPDSTGRILCKNSSGVVRQIDRYRIMDSDNDEKTPKLILQFGSSFSINEDGDKLVISLNVGPGGDFPIHGNEFHDYNYLTDSHAYDSHAHGGLLHEQGTDTVLAAGTEYEVLASDLRALLDRELPLPDNVKGWIFPPVNEIVEVYPEGVGEDYRVIFLTDNKIYTYESGSWVLDTQTETMEEINGYVVLVYDSPSGLNKYYVYLHEIETWDDITEELEISSERYQTIYGSIGSSDPEKMIRTCRPYFGTQISNTIRDITSSGKFYIDEASGIQDIPEFPNEEYVPGLALIEAVVANNDNLFYLYYRLNTSEIIFQSKVGGVYGPWKKQAYTEPESPEYDLSHPGLVVTILPEYTSKLEIKSYLANTTDNHVKFVLLNPEDCKNREFVYRHFKGTYTMTVERSSGFIYWNGNKCNIISSEAEIGFWIKVQSDGHDFYITADSGLIESNVNIIDHEDSSYDTSGTA